MRNSFFEQLPNALLWPVFLSSRPLESFQMFSESNDFAQTIWKEARKVFGICSRTRSNALASIETLGEVAFRKNGSSIVVMSCQSCRVFHESVGRSWSNGELLGLFFSVLA